MNEVVFILLAGGLCLLSLTTISADQIDIVRLGTLSRVRADNFQLIAPGISDVSSEAQQVQQDPQELQPEVEEAQGLQQEVQEPQEPQDAQLEQQESQVLQGAQEQPEIKIEQAGPSTSRSASNIIYVLEQSEIDQALGSMIGEELELWTKLLQKEPLSIQNIYLIMRRLIQIYEGKNFNYLGLNKSHLEKLVDQRPLRIANCSPELMKARRTFSMTPVIRRIPNFRWYLKSSDMRQYEICWQLFDRMLKDVTSDVFIGTKVSITAFYTTLVNAMGGAKLELDVDWQSDGFKSGIVEHVLNDRHSRLLFIKKAKQNELTLSVMKQTIAKLLEKACAFVGYNVFDFVEYYDYILPRSEPSRLSHKLNQNTRFWMADARLCHVLFMGGNQVYLGIYEKMLEVMAKIVGTQQIKPQGIDDPSSSEIGAYPSWNWNSMSNFKCNRENDRFGIRIKIDRRLKQEEFVDDEATAWNTLMGKRANFNFQDVSNALRKLRNIYTETISFRKIDSADIDNLINFRGIKLRNCSTEHMLRRWAIVTYEPFHSFDGIRVYLERYFEVQDQICWWLYESMLYRTVREFHHDVKSAMEPIEIRSIIGEEVVRLEMGVLDPSVFDKLANAIRSRPNFSDLITGDKNISNLTVQDVKNFAHKEFGFYCSMIIEDLGEFVAHYDVVANRIRFIDLSFHSRLWMAYTRICQALHDDRFMDHLHETLTQQRV